MFRKTVFYLLTASLLLASIMPLRAAGFSLTDLDGKAQTLAQYKGKWVLVNFWATWCPPCLEEIPDLIALHDNKKNNVVVIGVALDFVNTEQVKEFADDMMISYPIVAGNRKLAAQIGPVDGLPTTYLYNPQGKLVAHQLGPITGEAVMEFVRGAKKGGRT